MLKHLLLIATCFVAYQLPAMEQLEPLTHLEESKGIIEAKWDTSIPFAQPFRVFAQEKNITYLMPNKSYAAFPQNVITIIDLKTQKYKEVLVQDLFLITSLVFSKQGAEVCVSGQGWSSLGIEDEESFILSIASLMS